MEKLIRQFIAEANALIRKQATEITDLNGKLSESESATALAKHASEDSSNEIINLLNDGQYTQDSVTKAILKKDTTCLEKVATEVVDDSWGELDEAVVSSSNIRPSERKLYSNLHLV